LASLERDRVPPARPLPVKEVPLVDRTEEMNVLKEAVYQAAHGEGGLVFVYGEAGIGKTRLLRELGAYAQSRGVQVLHGRCPGLFRMDGVPPYVIWKEVIKDYLETCIPEQLYRVIGYYPAEVAKLVPELSQKLRTMPPSFPISPEQEQNRLFEAVSQFMTNISREAPLLVVLDDLQWTDPSSLLLLHYLARGVQKTPMLLLGAYRSTDVDAKHPLTPILAELNRERLPQCVSLKRMSPNDISEMIENILEQEDIPPEFCKMIYEKTRGNPFFAEEVIKSLKEEDVIYREKNRWKIKKVSMVEFPETVKSVVTARISRLDEQCQNVLTMASFVGNDFTFDALAGITGIEESKLQEIMDKLLKTGLIKHRTVGGEDLCSFADIIVRDVEYEEVGAFKRKKLHGIVGSTLERVYANKIDEHLGELAYHFLEGGDKNKALDYFLKAGEKAQRIYANAGVVSYFQSALMLLAEKEGGLQEKECVLERLGDVKKLVGEYEACMKFWAEGLQLRNQLCENLNVARLHRKMANVLWEDIGDVEKGKQHFDEALKILEAEPENVELARLYEDMAHMHYRVGSVPQARSWAEKGLELAKKLNAHEVVANSSISLGAAFQMAGDWQGAVECDERALKIALDNGYIEIASRAYNALGGTLPFEQWERAIECYEKGLELARKVGVVQLECMISMNLSNMLFQMGNMDRAVSLLEESVALSRRTGNLPNLSVSMMLLGEANVVWGEWEKGEQYYNEALDLSQRMNQHGLIANCYQHLGFLDMLKEDYARASEFFERAYEVSEKAGAKYNQMVSALLIIWSYIEMGEIEKANNLLNKFHTFAREVKDNFLIATAEALSGMMLRSQKQYAESIGIFEKTLKEWESLKANTWTSYYFAKWVLCEYARAYLERNQQGDLGKAEELLSQALEIFRKLGAKREIEKVEARIAFIETGKEVLKPKLPEHVSTGYADLDKLLYGGLPSNCAVVLTSSSCNERDLLVKSFLKIGAEKSEVTFYVTIDPSATKPLAEEFPSNFYLFVCNPEANAIVKSSANVFTLKGVENLTEVSIALTSAIRKLDPSLKGPRRICLGLVSDVLLQHHAVETRRWLTALMTKLKSEYFTTLAVFDPGMHSSQDARAILDLFDGEISLYEKETEKGLEKFLKIKKMSNQEYLKNELLLTKEEP
jgi:tetratricopeptide (TPR) repeat protein/KaiC/GvpD/RAD55 family RecA-like ATPase